MNNRSKYAAIIALIWAFQMVTSSVLPESASAADDPQPSTIVNEGGAADDSSPNTNQMTNASSQPQIATSDGTTSFRAGDNTVATPVTVDSNISIMKSDTPTLSSAQVRITSGLQSGEDLLMFVNNSTTQYGNILGSYDSFNGTLTLTSSGATATIEQWTNALRVATYTNSAITPNTANRIITFTVNDGTVSSNPADKTVTVTAVNQPPILTTTGGSSTFNGTAVAIDSGLTLSDLDNRTMSSASVTISGNFFSKEDILIFINDGSTMGNITGSYNAATGTLTLTSSGATATIAQWQQALRSVTYSNTSRGPYTSAIRTITFSVSDGTAISNPATKTVKVSNQPPVVTTSAGSTSYTAGTVPVDPALSISDPDDQTLASGRVSIVNPYHAGKEELQFTNDGATMGNISGRFDPVSGMLTLTSENGTATVSDWESAFRSVTYISSENASEPTDRTIRFVVSDGSDESNQADKGLTVQGLTRLSVSASSLHVEVGQRSSVLLKALYSNQTEIDVTKSAVWSTADPAVAEVANGEITGKSAGTTVITAVYGGKSESLYLTVAAKPVVSNPSQPADTPSAPSPAPGPTPTPAPTPTPIPEMPEPSFRKFIRAEDIAASFRHALAMNHPEKFADTYTHWAAKDIAVASRLGLVNGYGDGSFKPDLPISRAEISKLLVRAFALRQGNEVVTFKDMHDHWAAESIGILASNGIVKGNAGGLFQAERSLTRAEIAQMMANLADLSELAAGEARHFTDIADSYWAKDIIGQAAAAGLLEGRDESRFAPNEPVTRAEAVTMILRLLGTDAELRSLLEQSSK
ncbi:S-layer homology domain-containing protein [Paenibacillus cellulositrophicus]|uniref:S-layer homology domain-containing protein n=1 Tax=Paenibacillus cellulositrophicus TaxID=562959 RepID=UPI0020414535|nr:S-layer homology domain-containing protein [Paenibacillus cellulositrophicus]MCM2998223.1 S-layer homology domain-containing protein [Paenibacillus cellulositrophicus]